MTNLLKLFYRLFVCYFHFRNKPIIMVLHRSWCQLSQSKAHHRLLEAPQDCRAGECLRANERETNAPMPRAIALSMIARPTILRDC